MVLLFMIIKHCEDNKLCTPPRFLVTNLCYETVMGSQAYGVSTDSSDVDVYGFCIPPKADIFPHLIGEIPGFGKQSHRFDQYQQHHVADEKNKKEYDFSIYSIVKYFDLCMSCNPNMIDSLFTPRNCVTYSSFISENIRTKRRMFLHKGAYHRYRGYAYQQLHKLNNKNPDESSKRKDLIEKFGYDTKFAYHLIRILNQIEQIMMEGDLDLQRNNEMHKSIRRGEWTKEEVLEWAANKEKDLDKLYHSSTIPHGPDEGAIKNLLLESLEHHYGSISDCVVLPNAKEMALKEIKNVLEKYKI